MLVLIFLLLSPLAGLIAAAVLLAAIVFVLGAAALPATAVALALLLGALALAERDEDGPAESAPVVTTDDAKLDASRDREAALEREVESLRSRLGRADRGKGRGDGTQEGRNGSGQGDGKGSQDDGQGKPANP